MASMSEELSGQAGLLQSTIEFFRVDDTGRHVKKEHAETPGNSARKMSAGAQTAHVHHDIRSSRRSACGNDSGKSAGYIIGTDGNGADTDPEFERY